MKWRRTVLILAVVFISFYFTKNAYAYLDPGTGSSVFQLIVAAILGGVFALKLFGAKMIRRFKDHSQKKKKS